MKRRPKRRLKPKLHGLTPAAQCNIYYLGVGCLYLACLSFLAARSFHSPFTISRHGSVSLCLSHPLVSVCLFVSAVCRIDYCSANFASSLLSSATSFCLFIRSMSPLCHACFFLSICHRPSCSRALVYIFPSQRAYSTEPIFRFSEPPRAFEFNLARLTTVMERLDLTPRSGS